MKGKIKIKNSIKRFKVIFGLVCLVSLYILGKAMKTMLPPMSDYWEAVDDRFVSENIPIEANRGDLLSDDGRVLSTSLPEYRLYIDLRVQDRDSRLRAMTQAFRDSVIDHHVDEIAQGLSRIFPDYSEEYFRKKLVDARRNCLRKKDGRYPGPSRLYPLSLIHI